ncbi:hypothetical protein [Nocardia brasiliensis]|uniref:hypothetical protein n=1 Tax=Nocardia brasiliensis TaxID=37326 RepID=UPI002454193F|nr:hypothetical protein [Nocardia brasiliensis]
MSGVYWADVSQFQVDASKRPIPIDDTYPHPVFAFRSNSGDRADVVFAENARRVSTMLDDGRLRAAIVYYFLWPDQANCDLHRQLLEESGLWRHPRVVTMVDVESAGGRISGDVSAEANDEIARLRGWYGDPRRVIGYYNPRADPTLWQSRPQDLLLVVPHYNGTPGDSYDFPGRFAHQYGDAILCPPFGRCDMNYTGMDLPELLETLGIEGDSMSTAEDALYQIRGDATDSLAGNTGWKFLKPFDGFSVALGRIVDRLSVPEALGQLVFEATLRILPYRDGAKRNTAETVLGHAAAAHGSALDANDKLDALAQAIAHLQTTIDAQLKKD